MPFYLSLQMIWVCILCRKKQELLIKTGTWMHGSGSSDPILRRIEQDMAATPTSSHASGPMGGGGSLAGTPQNVPGSPAASISSFFSRAMSFTGTPTSVHPPNLRPNRPMRPFGLMGSGGGRGRGGLPRQRSLESSDSGLSPGGTSYVSGAGGPMGTGMTRVGGPGSYRLMGPGGSRLMRHQSEGGGDDTASLILSEGEATPTLASPSTYPSRFHSPHRGGGSGGRGAGRAYLTRGHSMGDPASPLPSVSGGPTINSSALIHQSASFHNRPVTSQISTPISLRSSAIPTGVDPTYSQHHVPTTTALSSSIGGRGHLTADSSGEMLLPMESVSAPEDAFGSDSGRDLYPRVLVSDSEARDVCPPLHLPSTMGGSLGADKRLLDPRSVPHSSSASGGSRRKLDSTFRNDSLSSDQSECLQQQRPPPPKPHKHRKHGLHPGGGIGGHRHSHRHGDRHHHGRPFMISSSDEDVRSTPECTSCGEEEMESESVSEKGRQPQAMSVPYIILKAKVKAKKT